MTEGALTIATWQRTCLAAWRSDSGDASSPRSQYAEGVSLGLHDFLMNHVVGQEAAAAVIHTLPRALSQCDLMDFDTWDEGISYLCWHMIDRYHRIQHVLDLLA